MTKIMFFYVANHCFRGHKYAIFVYKCGESANLTNINLYGNNKKNKKSIGQGGN